MKTITAILGLLIGSAALAQEETFSFDWAGFTDRHMRINVTGGNVTIQGQDGDTVTIVVTPASEPDDEPMSTAGGLRRLPNRGQNLVVRQDGSDIILRSGTTEDSADILVRLPHDAALSASSSMEGAIRVNDVHGELDLYASNGTIDVEGIRNAAVVHAQSDDVTASVATTDLPGPLVITSWAGDVELRMPAELRANLRWRTNYGEVMTDLDVTDVETVVEREESEDGTRIEGFTQGRLNGGGAEVSVTTFAGDIVLRRAE